MERTEIISTAAKLADTMGTLAALLDEESAGVYTKKNEELAGIYKEKSRLLADYAAGISSLRAVGTGSTLDLPAELNATMKTRSNLLAQAMERNVMALKVAHEASQRVVEIIIDAVKQQRHTGAAYGKDREGGLMLPAGEDKATAVTLDTRL